MKFRNGLFHQVGSVVEAFTSRVNTVDWVEQLMDLVEFFLGFKLRSIQVLDDVLVFCLQRLNTSCSLFQVNLLLVPSLAYLSVAIIMKVLFVRSFASIRSALV